MSISIRKKIWSETYNILNKNNIFNFYIHDEFVNRYIDYNIKTFAQPLISLNMFDKIKRDINIAHEILVEHKITYNKNTIDDLLKLYKAV